MNGFQYPSLEIDVLSAKTAFQTLLDRPRGINSRPWPPPQAEYIKVYLKEIGCQTLIVENHYIDRVFMHDVEVYYVRSLRSYPNFTKRVHFFRQSFDHADWHEMINRAGRGEYSVIQQDLQTGYLGFPVIRPLPDSPIGRDRSITCYLTARIQGGSPVFCDDSTSQCSFSWIFITRGRRAVPKPRSGCQRMRDNRTLERVGLRCCHRGNNCVLAS